MNGMRPYASLSGSLLARKGGAKPAMRPRPLTHESMLDDLGWNDMGDVADVPAQHVPSSIAGLTPAPKPVIAREESAPEPAREAAPQPAPEPAPEPAPVHVQQRALAETFGEPEAAEQKNLSEAVVSALRAPTPAPESKRSGPKQQAKLSRGRKAAFTLRLDPDRHLRLRVAAAVSAQSAQQLVTAALDQYLESFPELASLAKQPASKRS